MRSLLFLTLVLSLLAAPLARADLRLHGAVAVSLNTDSRAVRLAAEDLARDLHKILGAKPTLAPRQQAAPISITIDPALAKPESFQIDIAADRVSITGADPLGAIYGIYTFSHQCLGVDPFWYWKDIDPARRDQITLTPRQIVSTPATFKYRGWFINDEDLLTDWLPGSGPRFINYPFYATVINTDIADRIFETLLRTGGNLVIPASFVDVMNEPEANLVKRAAERGLYVTQHHIEPMGMSYFGFENYWKARGQNIPFAYGKDPAKVHETWRAYAKKWREVAGDQVIWQIGLRGRGDRSVWDSDKTVTEASAGKIISQAMAEQVKIIREADPRPAPPITTTLWHEMSKLMSKGTLEIPPGVCYVFCDEGKSQRLQDDFDRTPRNPDRTRGAYLHIGFWKNGPHLVQGINPRRLKTEFDRMLAKGDTHYAIINVCNVREHMLGTAAAMEMMQSAKDWNYDRFMSAWAPGTLRQGYERFFASFIDTGEMLIQDGHVYTMGETLLSAHEKKKKATVPFLRPGSAREDLARSIALLDSIVAEFDGMAKDFRDDQRRFHRNHLLVQARMLSGLYQWVLSLDQAFDDRTRLNDAKNALARLIEQRKEAETGRFQNWYNGDKKANIPRLLNRTQAVANSQ